MRMSDEGLTKERWEIHKLKDIVSLCDTPNLIEDRYKIRIEELENIVKCLRKELTDLGPVAEIPNNLKADKHMIQNRILMENCKHCAYAKKMAGLHKKCPDRMASDYCSRSKNYAAWIICVLIENGVKFT